MILRGLVPLHFYPAIPYPLNSVAVLLLSLILSISCISLKSLLQSLP